MLVYWSVRGGKFQKNNWGKHHRSGFKWDMVSWMGIEIEHVGTLFHLLTSSHLIISKHPTGGESFQQPLSMMHWQNTRWVWTTACARCLIASDYLAMDIPYIYAVYTPCSFWRIPRPNLSHTCAMDATLAYPCGGFVNLWCVSSNSLTDAWLLMSIYHHCWENLREHLWLRQGTNLSQSFDLKFKQSLVLGPYRRGEKKTSQEEHLESLVK